MGKLDLGKARLGWYKKDQEAVENGAFDNIITVSAADGVTCAVLMYKPKNWIGVKEVVKKEIGDMDAYEIGDLVYDLVDEADSDFDTCTLIKVVEGVDMIADGYRGIVTVERVAKGDNAADHELGRV